MNNSIPVCRSIQEHWIYKDAEYFKIWFEMLANARYINEPKTDMYEKIVYTLNRGEFIFGRISWSKRLGIGEQKIRTFIKKLIKENMIREIRKTSKFTIYYITNYDKFNQQNNQQQDIDTTGLQDNANQQNNQQLTISQPSANHQLTTNEEGREGNKKDKNVIIILNPLENEFISVLKTIENYTLDLEKDREMVSTLQERYPNLDLIQAIKDWAIYKKDNPLNKKSSPRSQINTSFKKYVEWGKCLKGVQRGSNNRDIEQELRDQGIGL